MDNVYSLPAVGTRFLMRLERAWSGPCVVCGRRKALKRRHKNQMVCHTHQLIEGLEIGWYFAEVTETTNSGLDGYIGYRTTERESFVNPLPGTNGIEAGFGGGMTASHWHDSIEKGNISLP